MSPKPMFSMDIIQKILDDPRLYKYIAADYRISLSYVAKLKSKYGVARCQKAALKPEK